MADISQYLQDILDAVYGEQVRGSIHDAIEVINDAMEMSISAGTAISSTTSSSTGFYLDSLYINTNTYDLWQCAGTNSWTKLGNLRGVGISSIAKTGTSGRVDTYTITFTDGTTSTFTVTNGINGTDGVDGTIWYKGTAITGTGTSITGAAGKVNDYYLNAQTGYVYVCVITGGAQAPNPAQWDYVMALTGGGGSSVIVIDNLESTSSTDALSANQGRVLKNDLDNKADANNTYKPTDPLETSLADSNIIPFSNGTGANNITWGNFKNNIQQALLPGNFKWYTSENAAAGSTYVDVQTDISNTSYNRTYLTISAILAKVTGTPETFLEPFTWSSVDLTADTGGLVVTVNTPPLKYVTRIYILAGVINI